MPCFKLNEVAERLDANERWLKARLVEDRQSPTPHLQFHHYIGTSPVWTLEAFEALKKALAQELRERRYYKGTGRPPTGWDRKSVPRKADPEGA